MLLFYLQINAETAHTGETLGCYIKVGTARKLPAKMRVNTDMVLVDIKNIWRPKGKPGRGPFTNSFSKIPDKTWLGIIVSKAKTL